MIHIKSKNEIVQLFKHSDPIGTIISVEQRNGIFHNTLISIKYVLH